MNAVFVHGLGGHAYDTWRRNGDDGTFWPAWLARDIPGLAAWTLAYDAPPSNWLGTGMALQDRAKNVLECLLGQPEMRGHPLVFVGHSLGGLVVKQVLRAADDRRAYSAVDAAFVDSVKGVVFIATPHTGSLHATLLDRLRLIAWPSASTLDLVKNNAGLRDLNVWYRNWSGGIRHKVFYEKRGTTAGVIVADDSSDPGLLRVDPVPVDADHIDICKPADDGDLVYARTRDFIADEIVRGDAPRAAWGALRRSGLPPLPRSRPLNLAPIAVRLAVLLIAGLVAFKGVQALLFPPDQLSAATVEQIAAALRVRSPTLTAAQIDQFIQSLRGLKNEPSFKQAVEEAQKGNTRIAEGIWLQIYENRKREKQQAEKEQTEAARNLAASTVVRDVAEGLKWYREAATLDTDNMASWVGLGEAGMAAGNLQEAERGFARFVDLARRMGNDGAVARGLAGRGDVLVAQGNLTEAMKSFQDALAIVERLAKSEPGNVGWQRDLSVSYNKIGGVLVRLGKLSDARKSFRDGLAIAERMAVSDPGNMRLQRDLIVSYEKIGDIQFTQGDLAEAMKSFRAGQSIAEHIAELIPPSDPAGVRAQRDLSVSYEKVGEVLVEQEKLPEALKSFRDGLAIRERLAQSDAGNTGWQRDLSVSYEKIGDVLAAQGNLQGALTSFSDGLAIRERLAQSDPSNLGWQRDLVVSHDKIGDVLVRQRHLAEAMKSFRSGLAIAERLAQHDRNNAGWQSDLSMSYEKVGDVLVEQGDLAEAMKSFGDGLAIRERLAQSDPGNAVWQRDLAVSHERVGTVELAMSRPSEARAAFEKALAIYDLLLTANPDNASFLQSSTVPLMRLGELDPDLQKTYFERALKILKDLDADARLEPGRKPAIAWLEGRLGR